MSQTDTEILDNVLMFIEFMGTFAFAISGIRHAAAKNFDWFGGFVCGIAVAIGGGTIRDVLLGLKPFWMTAPIYFIATFLALIFVIIFRKYMKRLDNTWFIFDTLGLALFTIAGMQKTLALGYPFWVAIAMGVLTGSAGGVIRDVLLNNVPVIFQKEIYAMASVVGGIVYWMMNYIDINVTVTSSVTFLIIVAIRFLAVRYHVSLPLLKEDQPQSSRLLPTENINPPREVSEGLHETAVEAAIEVAAVGTPLPELDILPELDLPKESHQEIIDGLKKEQRDKFVQKLRFLIEQEKVYLKAGIKIEEVATTLGTNRTYLSRIVKEVYGHTFADQMNIMRLRSAQQDLLTRRDVSIDTIALSNGFNSSNTFNKVFSQFLHSSPAAWRSKH